MVCPSRVKYACTNGALGTPVQTINYTFDANWKDKLTAYNGAIITYDVIGNPKSDGAWAYTWQAGRQLASMVKSDDTSVNFVYNADGLRVRKTVNDTGIDTHTDYTLHGKQVVHLKKDGNNLHFFYDAQGRPAVVDFNGVKYGYVHNLQGDVVAIIDGGGSQVVEYTYDAWGKPPTKSGALETTLGTFNPFRYRGYVFDEETGLYYLRSRYYNPVWGRFVNADTLLGGIGCLLTHNAYTYCKNNAALYSDHSGHSPYGVIAAIAVGISLIQSFKLLFTSISAKIQLRVNAITAIYREKEDLANRWKQRQERSWITGVFSMLVSQTVDSEADKYIWFRNMVNHRAPWDYKVNKPWWALTNQMFFDGELYGRQT